MPTTELARLVAGDPPSAGAPSGLRWEPSPFVLTVRGGVVTAADQMFMS